MIYRVPASVPGSTIRFSAAKDKHSVIYQYNPTLSKTEINIVFQTLCPVAQSDFEHANVMQMFGY